MIERHNITLAELLSAVDYAQKNGTGEFNTVTLSWVDVHVGDAIYVGDSWDAEGIDITDYSSF